MSLSDTLTAEFRFTTNSTSSARSPKIPIHPERSGFVAGKSHSIEPLKRYIVNNVRFFVTKAIDNYFAAKEALRGKKCVMQDFDADHELGQKVPELKDADKLPIVEELTDVRIDEIGPKVFREYFRV